MVIIFAMVAVLGIATFLKNGYPPGCSYNAWDVTIWKSPCMYGPIYTVQSVLGVQYKGLLFVAELVNVKYKNLAYLSHTIR